MWDIFLENRSLGWWQHGLFALGITPEQTLDIPKLQNITREKKCLFLQIETFDITWNITREIEWREKYFKKFITPYTALIDLSQSEDEILAQMKPKGRYNTRLAEKKWVIVKKVDKTQENIKIYFDLMQETTERDDFSGNTLEYYMHFLEIIPESELFLAYKDDTPIAGWIFVFGQELAIYYYGASTSDRAYRNLMAPYALQWAAIMHAKSLGISMYDFLWIASPDEKSSPLAGVTDFKLKLTPLIKEVSKSYLYVPSKWKYRVFLWFKYLKNIF